MHDLTITVIYFFASLVLAPLAYAASRKLVKRKAEQYERTPNDHASVRGVEGLAFVACFASFAIAGYYAPAIQAPVCCAIALAGFCVVVVDMRVRIIPNEIVVAVLVLGVALRALDDPASLLGSLICLVAAAAVLFAAMALCKALVKSKGVGAGDFKYVCVSAAAVGWPGIVFFLIGWAIGILVACFVNLLVFRKGIRSTFPMGPCISLGLLMGILCPLVPETYALVSGLL